MSAFVTLANGVMVRGSRITALKIRAIPDASKWIIQVQLGKEGWFDTDDVYGDHDAAEFGRRSLAIDLGRKS